MRLSFPFLLFGLLSSILLSAPQTADPPDQAAQANATKSETAPIISSGVSGIVAPGSVLTIHVTGENTHAVTIHSVSDPTQDAKFSPIAGDSTPDGLKIFLPPKMDTGPYYFRLTDKAKTVIPGSIDVEPDKIKLLSVFPATAYRGRTDRFDFDIAGENFSTNAENDDVTIEGQGSLVKSRGSQADKCANQKEACLWVENERLMHVVGYRPAAHQGIVNVGIRVGNVVAADKQQLVLARFSGTFVFVLGAALTGLLFWLVSHVVSSGLANKKVGRKRLALLQTFILDPETNSYSLSKFQLFAFAATFIFAYLYVLLSRWLVQWQFSLPDVPNTIAGLLGISAGTTVASAGLTAARGAKGAGFQQPSGADLISTGGVVVPERFQFFVWTIVACGGFLALLIGQDPAKVNDFPELPAGLLYVMGVSAAGYLGGKAARKPGPVLELIAVRQGADDQTPPALIAQGQNLGSDGRFFVDDKELGIVSDADVKQFTKAPPKRVECTTQIGGGTDTNFCKGLQISVLNTSIDLTKGDHLFRIVNRDGQFADLSFAIPPPAIQSVYEQGNAPSDPNSTLKQLPESTTEIIAVVKGLGLRAGSHVSWKPQGADAFTDQKSSPADPPDDSMLIVTLIPGTAGRGGTLNVTTPSGFTTNADVDVVPRSSGTQQTSPTAPVPQSTTPPKEPTATDTASTPSTATPVTQSTTASAAQSTMTSGTEAPGAPAGAQGEHPADGSAAAPNKPT